jgi:RimJ/RimL family protein N-acetyltransferase
MVGLRLTTPRLQLRLPGAEELAELADVAAAGIHDPAVMPFTVPWTDQSPADRARSVVQHHWKVLGSSTASRWTLPFAVFLGGKAVGMQDISAAEFAARREVSTGSWLARAHHGQGIGTEMRAAVLHLAFAELQARDAVTAAFDDNAASLGVSRKLGYQPDGIERHLVRESVSTTHRLRLTRTAWQAHATVKVTVEGLAPCLPHLGLDSSDTACRSAVR